MAGIAAVAIFVHSPDLTWDEVVSLRQCWKVLSDHPLFLVHPRGMDIGRYLAIAPGLRLLPVDPRHLASVRSYNRLKLDPELYGLFRDFEFMLTYELDAFVFRDELLRWCDMGYDYIGAPWFEGWYGAKHDAKVRRGQNSGFSLRRISSAQRVLRSFRLVRPLKECYERWRPVGRLSPGSLVLLLKWCFAENCFHPRFNQFTANEDEFWSHYADRSFAWFKIANYGAARQFSFEALPERLLAENGHQLPFGCHKWSAPGLLPFWKPHIEACGHKLRHADPPNSCIP